MRWLLVAALMLHARPADACSCDPGSLLYPTDRSVVPVNAAVIAYSPFGIEPVIEVRVAGSTEPVAMTVEIEERDGVEVGFDKRDVWVVARPALVADTAYELVVDNEGWVETIQFRTDAPALPPLAFAGLAAIQTEVMPYPITQPDGSSCSSSCQNPFFGFVSRMRLEHAEPTNPSVLKVLSLYRNGVLVDEIPIRPFFDTSFVDSGGCSAHFDFMLDAEYCASLRTYDEAGQRAGDEVLVCTTTRTCAPKHADNTCDPSPDCDELAEPSSSSSGCATTGGGGFALVLLVWALARRRC